MQTQVAIIGAGPAGMLLSHILRLAGIECVVLERQSRDYVLLRVRAGLLEWESVETLRSYGLGERLDRLGHRHDTINIAWRGKRMLTIDTVDRVGKQMMAYGQTDIQEDLYRAADAAGATVLFEVDEVLPRDIASESPSVTFMHNGAYERLECDYIAGCDGFHGVSRQSIPTTIRREFEKIYPFGWLGILSETPPLPVLVYANHDRGFALCSMRNPMLSRYYVQCSLDDSVDDWSDDRFWTELFARIPPEQAAKIATGPSVEKSIAPLRSFVSEPMQYGRMFLAGDAAHIVPPTGAKGLNLAVSDVRYLSRALIDHYSGDDGRLETYSDRALHRVWGAMRFSWSLTMMLHRFPDQSDFDQRTQERELEYLATSPAAQTALAEQYVGLPYDD